MVRRCSTIARAVVCLPGCPSQAAITLLYSVLRKGTAIGPGCARSGLAIIPTSFWRPGGKSPSSHLSRTAHTARTISWSHLPLSSTAALSRSMIAWLRRISISSRSAPTGRQRRIEEETGRPAPPLISDERAGLAFSMPTDRFQDLDASERSSARNSGPARRHSLAAERGPCRQSKLDLAAIAIRDDGRSSPKDDGRFAPAISPVRMPISSLRPSSCRVLASAESGTVWFRRSTVGREARFSTSGVYSDSTGLGPGREPPGGPTWGTGVSLRR